MKDSQDPDFGATGQFELTGVYFVDKKVDTAFASTMGMEQFKNLVLLGAGPVHQQVLRELARQRRSDLDVTLVTPWLQPTPARLLPGCVAGQHRMADCQLDLVPLLEAVGARWMAADCGGLDAGTSSVLLNHNPKAQGQGHAPHAPKIPVLSYHFLSIDTSQSEDEAACAPAIPGASDWALNTQPTARFVREWPSAAQRLKTLSQQRAKQSPKRGVHVAVVGHSTAAFELACALRQWFVTERIAASVHLLTQGKPLLPLHPPGVQRRAQATLKRLGIVEETTPCAQVQNGALVLVGGRTLESDLTLLSLPPRMPTWLSHSGLALDGRGRVATNAALQSTSHRQVMVTGPASNAAPPAPGACDRWAAETGSTLALNLRALASEQPLTPAPPSRHTLGFVDCGGGHAIAHWGPWSAEGLWAGRWQQRHNAASATQRPAQAPHA